MKKPIFSGKLYVQSLKKVRTLGIAVMIAVVLLNMFLPIMGIIDGIQTDRRHEAHLQEIEDQIKYYEEHPEEAFNNYYDLNYYIEYLESIKDEPREPQPVEDYEFAPFLWAMMGFAPLLVIAMFSFLNERKQSDFYHSLPQTRVCMYLSMVAAIFTWLIGVIVVSVGVNALLWGFAKYYTFTFGTVLSNIVFYFVLGLFMSGSLAVAMMITGTTVSNLLIYAFLMLFPRYLYTLFLGSLSSAIDILPNVEEFATILSFERFLPLSWADGAIFRNGNGLCYDSGMLIYSAIIGILMFALAGFLYHIRRSESATKSAPNELFQHIYRTAFTTAMAIMIPFAIILDGINEIVILLLMLVLVVHVLYELLTTKKIKKMVKSLPLIFIPLVLATAFGLSVLGAKAYVYSVRPEADDVKSVSFSNYSFVTYGEYLMEDKEITDKDVIRMALQGLYNKLDERERPHDGGWTRDFTATYTLKSGRKISRYVWLTDTEWQQLCMTDDMYLMLPEDEDITGMTIYPMPGSYIRDHYDAWMDDGEVKDIYTKDTFYDNYGFEFKTDDAVAMQKRIWKLFKEEYAALSREEKIELLHYSNYVKRADSYYIEVRVNEYDENRFRDYTRHFYYQLLPDYTPKTVEFIMSLYGTDEKILDALKMMKSEELGGSVSVYTMEGKEHQRFYVDTKYFFEYVTLDEHLFEDGKQTTLVVINGYHFWLNLTKVELANILSQYGNVEIYDDYYYDEYYYKYEYGYVD